MNFVMLKRHVLSAMASTALLSGCESHQPAQVADAEPFARSSSNQQVFEYTGSAQTFSVPAGVTQVTVLVTGAGGAGPADSSPGSGGLVKAEVPVNPSEMLWIYVGGSGTGRSGGFNGGGDGGRSTQYGEGFGGGGASDIRESGSGLNQRIVVAGGGAGSGGPDYPLGGAGGNGGRRSGGDGLPGNPYSKGGGPGIGGSMRSGGAGGRGVAEHGCKPIAGSGAVGKLGVGGSGGRSACAGGGGGGGGGGYFGGGGGGGGAGPHRYFTGGGGGGGGSSFIEQSAKILRNERGRGPLGANGEILISW